VQVAWRNQRQRRTSIPHQAFLKQHPLQYGLRASVTPPSGCVSEPHMYSPANGARKSAWPSIGRALKS
jgi:hypothetical protein